MFGAFRRSIAALGKKSRSVTEEDIKRMLADKTLNQQAKKNVLSMEQARKRLEEARKSKEDDDDDDEGMDRLVAQAYQELHEEEEAKKRGMPVEAYRIMMRKQQIKTGGGEFQHKSQEKKVNPRLLWEQSRQGNNGAPARPGFGAVTPSRLGFGAMAAASAGTAAVGTAAERYGNNNNYNNNTRRAQTSQEEEDDSEEGDEEGEEEEGEGEEEGEESGEEGGEYEGGEEGVEGEEAEIEEPEPEPEPQKGRGNDRFRGDETQKKKWR